MHALVEETSLILHDFPLCQLRLLDDRNCPYFIMIPKIQGLRSLKDMSQEERFLMVEEIVQASQVIEKSFSQPVIKTEMCDLDIFQFHIRLLTLSGASQVNVQKGGFFDCTERYSSVEKEQIISAIEKAL